MIIFSGRSGRGRADSDVRKYVGLAITPCLNGTLYLSYLINIFSSYQPICYKIEKPAEFLTEPN